MKTVRLSLPFALAVALVCAIVLPASAGEVLKGNEYGLSKCYCGERLDSKGVPATISYKGRELRFCGPKCKAQFEKNPNQCIKQIDDGIISMQKAYYPLSTCVVTDQPLSENSIDYVYNNQLVRFSSHDALNEFQKHPKKYIKKLDKAAAACQTPTYPMETCPVTGKKLDCESLTYLSSNRIIRFCDDEALNKFRKDPGKYINVLDQAQRTGSALSSAR